MCLVCVPSRVEFVLCGSVRCGLFGQLETGVVRDRQRAGGGADVFFLEATLRFIDF